MINRQRIDYPYFTVLVKFKGESQWFPEFGDDSKDIVQAEAQAFREDGHRTKIITTEFTDRDAVFHAVARLNAGYSL